VEVTSHQHVREYNHFNATFVATCNGVLAALQSFMLIQVFFAHVGEALTQQERTPFTQTGRFALLEQSVRQHVV